MYGGFAENIVPSRGSWREWKGGRCGMCPAGQKENAPCRRVFALGKCESHERNGREHPCSSRRVYRDRAAIAEGEVGLEERREGNETLVSADALALGREEIECEVKDGVDG